MKFALSVWFYWYFLTKYAIFTGKMVRILYWTYFFVGDILFGFIFTLICLRLTQFFYVNQELILRLELIRIMSQWTIAWRVFARFTKSIWNDETPTHQQSHTTFLNCSILLIRCVLHRNDLTYNLFSRFEFIF